MRKVIKGKVYDIDKARELLTWTHSNPRDFGYIRETLYVKRTGEYFIEGEGGAATKYREWIDSNSWTGGGRITPVTEQEAREWVEQHFDADEYEMVFGKVDEEDGTLVTRTYSLPTYIADKLKREAVRRGIPASQVLAELIENM